MGRVLLASFCLLPEGELGGERLVTALAERGIEAAWAAWDDPDVDWACADLVAVRATWDYHRRWPAFLSWARGVAASTRLLNGVNAFEWNHHKGYLVELGSRVPVVPTVVVPDDDLRGGLAAALERFGTVVLKPCVGASGVGVVVATTTRDWPLAGLTSGPWVAQPLVESVRVRGESSVVVLGGRPVAQVDKVPGRGEIRVHEQYGGVTRPVPLDITCAEVAVRAVAAAEDLLGHGLDYARVDLMEHDGELVVSELELIEPGLYLDVDPSIADAFADLVVDRLG